MAATTLLDIPFEVLPIQTVAQLANLCKASEERAHKEFLTRNVGLEVYLYLCTLSPAVRAFKIAHDFSTKMMWTIVRAIHPRNSICPLIIPFNYPVRADICIMRYHENLTWMIHIHSTMHINCIVPTILQNYEVLSYNMPQAIHILSTKINELVTAEIVRNYMHEYVDVEWHTNPIPFYCIQPNDDAIYIIPSFPFSWHNGYDTQPASLVSQITYDECHLRCVVNTLVDANL
jgi:hypothetical protein